MKRFGMMVVLVGCTDGGSPAAPDAPVPVIVPDALAPVAGDCSQHITLYGMDDTTGRVVLGPLALDTQGVTVCLTLDARDNLVVGHFGADSGREAKTMSTFQLSLFDAQGTLLQDGWDVTFGGPTTFAGLEYGVAKGTVLETKLLVRTKVGSATTTVGMDLIEPYE